MAGDLDVPPSADVVILGELHDNPIHHENQARAVAAIMPKALVFEMLTPDQAAAATPEARSDAARLEAALRWSDGGWPAFSMYWPIFAAAPDAAVLGAALPRDLVRQSVMDGAVAVFEQTGNDPAQFGLDQPLPEAEQTAREEMQQEAHCNALPPQMLPGMVDAQRLRDAAFANAVARAVETYGTPVVLITGNGHARRDWGVPVYLSAVAPELSTYVLGQFEDAPDADYAEQFDAWIVSAPAEREDPCAVFRS
ncbi:ChaN family lipoprotein [Tropicimonas sp. S265A]|uniref:ChaN family lipoprotein n=1 Tax=Tropicimonas sp. S265A TaxID=3415134 RepID=UPI003C7C6F2A